LVIKIEMKDIAISQKGMYIILLKPVRGNKFTSSVNSKIQANNDKLIKSILCLSFIIIICKN